jgi:hypothetical protein
LRVPYHKLIVCLCHCSPPSSPCGTSLLCFGPVFGSTAWIPCIPRLCGISGRLSVNPMFRFCSSPALVYTSPTPYACAFPSHLGFSGSESLRNLPGLWIFHSSRRSFRQSFTSHTHSKPTHLSLSFLPYKTSTSSHMHIFRHLWLRIGFQSEYQVVSTLSRACSYSESPRCVRQRLNILWRSGTRMIRRSG